jgi:hypothetical protein
MKWPDAKKQKNLKKCFWFLKKFYAITRGLFFNRSPRREFTPMGELAPTQQWCQRQFLA